MVTVTDMGTDDVMMRPVGEVSQLTYTITNVGDLPLDLTDMSWASANPNNVSAIALALLLWRQPEGGSSASVRGQES